MAGFSLETATRRGGGREGGRAVVMRVRMEVRLVERSWAREGSIFISGGWSDGCDVSGVSDVTDGSVMAECCG